MKNMKKLLAVLVAVMMVAISMAALAENAGDLHVNGALTVSGLDKGDKVHVYHVLQYDANAQASHGWVYGDNISSSDQTNLLALTGGDDGENTITGELASFLASHIKGSEVNTVKEANADGVWQETVTKAGLYMVIVEPATPGTIYNPIFVAANYYGDGEIPDSANSFIVTSDTSYSNGAMAKKSTIPLDKTTSGTDGTDGQTNAKNAAYTTEPGEIVKFEVTTTIPKFGANYTSPVFKLTDNLTGLELLADSETNGAITVEATDSTTIPTNAYTVTKATDMKSYTVVIDPDYLKGTVIPQAGQDIKITYYARVTDDAEQIVNQENNTVDLVFSTKPDDTTGAGLLRDETNHFTFSIDANLLGHDDIHESSTEAIKVGKDKAGNIIVSSHSYEWSGETHGPLVGAKFELLDKNKNSFDPKKEVFSDETGRITILGLDAGEYWLREVTAPAGYIKMQEDVKVEISADITEEYTVKDEVMNGTTPVKVTYKTNKLNSYSVKIGNSTTSYTINLSASTAKAIEASRSVDSSDSELVNTKGTELPSTGGMGTTLFYIGGAVLVLGAVVVMITRRRVRG